MAGIAQVAAPQLLIRVLNNEVMAILLPVKHVMMLIQSMETAVVTPV